MTDEKGETWSPSGMSKVRSRPESLVADCSMHAFTIITTLTLSPLFPLHCSLCVADGRNLIIPKSQV